MSDDLDANERIVELEIKLAYQEHVIRGLEALIRSLGDRLDATDRELLGLKQSMASPEIPLGPSNEPPPHY